MSHKTTKSLHSMLNAVMEVGVCLFAALVLERGRRVWGMLGKGSVPELQSSKMPVCISWLVYVSCFESCSEFLVGKMERATLCIRNRLHKHKFDS